jgi:Zn-dependent protease/CBS domain-containing protein
MFERQVPLFKLKGFKVGMDWSWLILALLVTWSLAAGLFPHYLEGLSTATYWWMGAAGAVGLFISIVFHEFCHSLVARHYGMPIRGITLFVFGGVAQMEEEPPTAKSELIMASAGPLSSAALAGIFYLANVSGHMLGWPVFMDGILGYLIFINLLLALFNLIPAFPLDGGRMLRAGLWSIKGNLRWATRIASTLGAAFGAALIVLGVFQIIFGNFIGGLWYALIGLFIRSASQMSYQHLVVRQALKGEPVQRFMQKDLVTVPPDTSVQALVDDYIYRYHHKLFPVSNNGHLRGCVTTGQLKTIPREQWPQQKVADIAASCGDGNTIAPESDALQALSQMRKTGNTRLLVVRDNTLQGLITLKDMLQFLALKLDLENEESIPVHHLELSSGSPGS